MDAFIIFYLFILYSVTWIFFVTSLLVLCHHEHLFLHFYFNIAPEVVTVLFIFVDIYQFNHTFSRAYIKAHTHKHTFVISAW